MHPENEPVCPLCGTKAREGNGEPFFGVVVVVGDVWVHGICLNENMADLRDVLTENMEVLDGEKARVA
jgi:hypothetical protein